MYAPSQATPSSTPPVDPRRSVVCIGQLSAEALLLNPLAVQYLSTGPPRLLAPGSQGDYVPVRLKCDGPSNIKQRSGHPVIDEMIRISVPLFKPVHLTTGVPAMTGGEDLGVIDPRFAKVLVPLMQKTLIRLEAHVKRHSGRHSPPRLPLRVLVFTPQGNVNVVSAYILSGQLVLEHPSVPYVPSEHRDSPPYENPHQMPGMSGMSDLRYPPAVRNRRSPQAVSGKSVEIQISQADEAFQSLKPQASELPDATKRKANDTETTISNSKRIKRIKRVATDLSGDGETSHSTRSTKTSKRPSSSDTNAEDAPVAFSKMLKDTTVSVATSAQSIPSTPLPSDPSATTTLLSSGDDNVTFASTKRSTRSGRQWGVPSLSVASSDCEALGLTNQTPKADVLESGASGTENSFSVEKQARALFGNDVEPTEPAPVGACRRDDTVQGPQIPASQSTDNDQDQDPSNSDKTLRDSPPPSDQPASSHKGDTHTRLHEILNALQEESAFCDRHIKQLEMTNRNLGGTLAEIKVAYLTQLAERDRQIEEKDARILSLNNQLAQIVHDHAVQLADRDQQIMAVTKQLNHVNHDLQAYEDLVAGLEALVAKSIHNGKCFSIAPSNQVVGTNYPCKAGNTP